MATSADLSLDEKRFLVSLLEAELLLYQVSGYMEGVPNGEKIMLDLRANGLVAPSPPYADIHAPVRIGITYLSHEGRLLAEELRAEGVEPFTPPPTHS
jgi:hypothetical protein